jgi:hypothetical protein
LGEARTLVRQYINEPLAARWSDATLNGVIQEANREIWHKLSTSAPNWLAGSNQFTWPANAASLYIPTVVPVSGGTIGILQKVLGFFVVPNSGAIGNNNIPTPMRGITRIADLYGQRGQYVDGSPVQPSAVTGQTWAQFNYTLLGTTAYIWPVPQQALIVNIYGVATVATPTSDAHNLLVGHVITDPTVLPDHHELVPLLASVKAKAMVGDPDNGLASLYASRLQSSIQVLTLDQQMQDPQQVRGVVR